MDVRRRSGRPGRMNDKAIEKISKYFSFILRHKPEAIGLKLDSEGWANVTDLIDKTTDFDLTKEIVDIVVETNDKQRFKLNSNKAKIKANQGHSISIDFNLEALEPPDSLFHGTAERFIESINLSGLKKQKRHHVHLTESISVAKSVGRRYGQFVLLKVDAKRMHDEGFSFFKTENNVWLVEEVPSEYIKKV